MYSVSKAKRCAIGYGGKDYEVELTSFLTVLTTIASDRVTVSRRAENYAYPTARASCSFRIRQLSFVNDWIWRRLRSQLCARCSLIRSFRLRRVFGTRKCPTTIERQ